MILSSWACFSCAFKDYCSWYWNFRSWSSFSLLGSTILSTYLITSIGTSTILSTVTILTDSTGTSIIFSNVWKVNFDFDSISNSGRSRGKDLFLFSNYFALEITGGSNWYWWSEFNLSGDLKVELRLMDSLDSDVLWIAKLVNSSETGSCFFKGLFRVFLFSKGDIFLLKDFCRVVE